MKIGILTFHNGYNYGASAQVYALQEYLKSLNDDDDVVVIDYKNVEFTLREYRHFLISKSLTWVINNFKKIISFKNEQKLLNLTERFFFNKSLMLNKFDIVIFGSDSIWNYSNSLSKNDFTYFGENVSSKVKASYAASFGPDKYEDNYPAEIEVLLNDFDYLGVRDTNTSEFVKNILSGKKDVQPQIVLDPTFLFDFRAVLKAPSIKNYILVYSIVMEKEQVEEIVRLAKMTSKTLVSVGYKLDWCDYSFTSVSPFEWIGFIDNADFVITHMYHGTLLSMQLNKNFATFVTPYRRNKIKDVLSRFDLSSRMLEHSETTKLGDIYNRNIDYNITNKLIKKQVESSKQYLKNILLDYND
jgi:polysaccharide pyruvyl transferase WcaK-like protein